MPRRPPDPHPTGGDADREFLVACAVALASTLAFGSALLLGAKVLL